MDFTEEIKQFAQRIITMTPSITNEESTKMSMIIPFFQLLGYDVFNPSEFYPEYTADVGIKKGEKVDYAVLNNGTPEILIECKWCGESLTKHDSQLFRYFATCPAKFAIRTNGLCYKFYTDLDEANKMDMTPFLEIDMTNLRDTSVNALKKFCKDSFDKDSIFSVASELKYSSLIKDWLRKQSTEISDDFAKTIFDISKRQIVLNRRHQNDVAGSGFAYRLRGWQPWQAVFRLAAARQCGQKIFQITCRVQPVDLCGLNQRIDHCADLRAKRRIAEQPVLSPNGKRSYRTLCAVVGQFQPSVAENVHQPALLPQGIAKRCAIETLWHRIFLVFILRPPKEFSGNWLGSLFPLRISLFRRKRLPQKLRLQRKQSVAEIESGLRRGAAAQLFGQAPQRIRKFSPHMRPAANAAYRFGQTAMICLIPIRMQISRKALQEPACADASSARLVIIKHNRPQSIAGCPVEPYIAALPCLTPRLPQHHERRLICMQDLVCKKLLVQCVIYRQEPAFSGGKNPVGHGLPGNGQTKPVQLLLLQLCASLAGASVDAAVQPPKLLRQPVDLPVQRFDLQIFFMQ